MECLGNSNGEAVSEASRGDPDRPRSGAGWPVTRTVPAV